MVSRSKLEYVRPSWRQLGVPHTRCDSTFTRSGGTTRTSMNEGSHRRCERGQKVPEADTDNIREAASSTSRTGDEE